jgi:hypothetical protein
MDSWTCDTRLRTSPDDSLRRHLISRRRCRGRMFIAFLNCKSASREGA